MPVCSATAQEKEIIAKKLGPALVKRHGQKKFYAIREIVSEIREIGLRADIACWGHALFASHPDFTRHHQITGETCDYAAMKTEMLSTASGSDLSDWLPFDIDLSWVELPDLGSFFDWS